MLWRQFMIVAAIILTLFGQPAFAQANVFIEVTAPDPVGSRLAYAIKEGIRRSAGMSLADREEDSLIGLSIVTLDPDRSDAGGNRTIYSVVWTARTLHSTPVTMYLTNSVGICGSNRVTSCADSLVADTDAQATKVRGWIRNIVDRAKK